MTEEEFVDTRDYDFDLGCLLATEEGALAVVLLRPDPEWVTHKQTREALEYVYARYAEHRRVPTREELLTDLGWKGDVPEPEVEADWVVEKIRDRHLTKQMGAQMVHITRRIYNESPLDAARAMVAEGTRVLMEGDTDGIQVRNLEGIMERLERSHSETPASFGFDEIDEAYGGGMYPGQLYFVTARTGGFKSWLLMHSALRTIEKVERDVVFFTLELEAWEQQERLLAMVAEMPYERVRRGHWNRDDKELLDEAAATMNDWNVGIEIIEQKPGERTVPQMMAKAKLYNPAAVYIDQFYDIEPTQQITSRKDNEARAATAHELKHAAKDFPIYLAAQLNRDLKNAKSVWDVDSTHVGLTDAIGQKSDVVLVSFQTKGMREGNVFQLGSTVKSRSFAPRAWVMRDELDMNSALKVDGPLEQGE